MNPRLSIRDNTGIITSFNPRKAGSFTFQSDDFSPLGENFRCFFYLPAKNVDEVKAAFTTYSPDQIKIQVVVDDCKPEIIEGEIIGIFVDQL